MVEPQTSGVEDPKNDQSPTKNTDQKFFEMDEGSFNGTIFLLFSFGIRRNLSNFFKIIKIILKWF